MSRILGELMALCFAAAFGAALSYLTGLPDVVALLFVCLAGLLFTIEWVADSRGPRPK